MFKPVRVAIIGGAIIATLSLAACSGTDTTSTSDPKPPVTTQPTPEPSEAEQTTAWWAEASHDLDNLAIDLDTMADIYSDPAAVIADPSEAEAAMGALLFDVQQLKDHGPIPMASVNEPWQHALDEYEQGFELALTGTRNLDPSVLDAGTAHIEEGTRYLVRATAALDKLNAV